MCLTSLASRATLNVVILRATRFQVARARGNFMQTEQQVQWSEHPDHLVPGHILEGAKCGTLSDEFTSLHVSLSVRRLPSGHATHFHARLGDSLIRVYEEAAEALQEKLLPPQPTLPLDLLLFQPRDGEWRPPVTSLEAPLWEALAEGMSRHLGIEYRLIVRINAKWGVATSERMTPRGLLAEFGFDPAQFQIGRAHV